MQCGSKQAPASSSVHASPFIGMVPISNLSPPCTFTCGSRSGAGPPAGAQQSSLSRLLGKTETEAQGPQCSAVQCSASLHCTVGPRLLRLPLQAMYHRGTSFRNFQSWNPCATMSMFRLLSNIEKLPLPILGSMLPFWNPTGDLVRQLAHRGT